MSNKDTIYKQDVIDAIVAWTVQDRPDVEMPTDLIDRINALPSAESEIIRCKDCKHWSERFPTCNKTGKFGYGVNDFCSKAERKEQ